MVDFRRALFNLYFYFLQVANQLNRIVRLYDRKLKKSQAVERELSRVPRTFSIVMEKSVDPEKNVAEISA